MKLTVKDLTEEDYGSYKCVAKNSRGETEGKMNLYSEYKFLSIYNSQIHFIDVLRYICFNYNFYNIKRSTFLDCFEFYDQPLPYFPMVDDQFLILTNLADCVFMLSEFFIAGIRKKRGIIYPASLLQGRDASCDEFAF